MPKAKTHSGAKKRFKVLASGKVLRKQTRLRHLNSHMSSKVKRQLGGTVVVSAPNMLQLKRQLLF
jgi:large subunit ribosomal protein L35